ncbi:MAG: CvpA family protein, partial [Chloroflexota bacterium]
MNAIDLLIGAAIVLAIVAGIRAGFVKTLFGLITWVVAIPVSLILQAPLGSLLARTGLAAPSARTIAFVAVLLLIEIGFTVVGSILVAPFVDRLHRDRALGMVDRAFGVLPSVLRTLVIT